MTSPRVLLLSSVLSLLAVTSSQAAENPAVLKLQSLEAQPTAVDLKNPYAYRQLILTGIMENGERVDVTRSAQITKPACVSVSPTGQVRPLSDGSGALEVAAGGKTLSIPVTVSGQKAKYPVSFVQDVMPTLSRMGCNAGTCHGAQDGKNGFKLSLRGYDPLYDHRSLTDDLEGRRFNRAAPDTSLMLLKPSGGVPHVGGVISQPGEPYYELLRAWIAGGVKLDINSPRVTKIEVLPKSATIPLPGMKQQMAVLATFSDGIVRDVTAEAFVDSSNLEVATTDRQATVSAVRRGEATVLARYEGAYAAATIVVMGDRSGFAWQETPEYNYIDTLVYEKLRQVKVLPSDVCSDAEFVRRLFLDLTGLPPQPQEIRQFLADPRPTRQKREALVDRLVGSPEYLDHWTNKWADLLQVNRKFLGEQGAAAFREYIHKSLAANEPYDKFVHGILVGSGSNLDNPAASYYKVLREPEAAMENTTQLFLAVRFNCNKCHDHPFERWTQNQYYELSAFFAQVERHEDERFKGQRLGGTDVEGGKPLVEVIKDGTSGEVKHVRTGQIAKPSFPYSHPDVATGKVARREQLAHWITSKENPYFAKSYVNRVWSYLLGVGLIEPIDDIRAGNPPTNPKLLDRLTREFIDGKFDVQALVKTICKSRVYQHSVTPNRWNADDEINYSHALARRLPAEVLYDAIQRVTGSTSHLPGLPPGARAAQLLDSAVDVPGGFLDLFGKPARESACECERSGTMMLGPVLNMVNGPVVADAVKDPNNRIAELLKSTPDNARLVEDLYLAVLGRMPSDVERSAGVSALQAGEPYYAEWVAEYERRVAELQAYEKQLDARQPAWEAEMMASAVWEPLEIESAKSAAGAKLIKERDGSVLATGKNGGPETYTVDAKTRSKRVTAIRLEVMADPSLGSDGPGRAPNGNFVLNEFKLFRKGPKGELIPLGLHKAQATYSQDGYAVAGAIDGNPDSGWAVNGMPGKNQTAIFELQAPIDLTDATVLTATLLQRFPSNDHNIGRFRLSVTSAKAPTLVAPPVEVVKLLDVEPARRTPQQRDELMRYFRSFDQNLPRLQHAVAEVGRPVDKRHPGAQDLVWALINSKAFQFNH